MSKKTTIIGMSVVTALTTAAVILPVFSAHAEPPQGAAGTLASPNEGAGQAPGGQQAPGVSSSSVTHSGVMTFTEDMSTDGESYNSTGNAENAILMTGGTVTLTNPVINKTGSDDGDSSDFYGTNAAVFVSGGTLNVSGGSLTTDGSHANGFFAYGEGIINVSNTTIKTSSNNSGALMVTGGGTLTATYVTATTDGNSSAPIRSDRGGGTMNIEDGSYASNGVGSPVIYSTADVNVKKATLESTASEGVVIEGKNSVSLDGVKMTANNTQLNGQSETYKGIFIYQSMSGDADEGVGSFTAKNSDLTVKNGDTFFVTNTTAEINLSNNTFTNTAGGFLRVQTGKWGNSGANGGVVVLTASEQEMTGDVFVDNISSLDMKMSSDSYYKGALNHDNTAQTLRLELSSDSVVVLTGDSYISELANADTENTNIYGNGFKLYVAGSEVKTNSETAPEGRKNKTTSTTESEDVEAETKTVDDYSTLGFILAMAGSLVVLIVGGILIARCMKKPAPKTGPDQDVAPSKPEIAPMTGPDATPERAKDAGEMHSQANGGQVKGPDAR